MKFSVIIPVFNGQKTIIEVRKAYQKIIWSFHYCCGGKDI